MIDYEAVMISAYQPSETPDNNFSNYVGLGCELLHIGADYKSVTGVYKGKPQNSYIVTLKDEININTLKAIATSYGQHVIIHLLNDLTPMLIDLDTDEVTPVSDIIIVGGSNE